MTQLIRKAVIPVAGRGSRFYPATLATPKEMLPIVDKPLIQYVVEELIDAGIDQIYFVINAQKKSIENHFDAFFSDELADRLPKEQRERILSAQFIYLRQPKPLGLGHAVWCAKRCFNNEPFMMVLPDEFLVSEGESFSKKMIDMYHLCQHSVIGVQEVSPEKVIHYGIVETHTESRNKVRKMIEKPNVGQSPSRLAAIGRYVLTPDVFSHLESNWYQDRGEIQLTPALHGLAVQEGLSACEYTGYRFDCGQKKGYIQANVFLSCRSEELSSSMLPWLKNELELLNV